MKLQVQAGFEYLVEVLDKHGNVLESEVVHNLMPVQALNHMIGATFKGESQNGSWYVGIYEGNYTPLAGDTAATFPAAATECTAYAEAARRTLTLGAISGGAVDNSAVRAEFTMNATKTVYGGFISSASAKGATTGILGSAVRFSTPKSLEPDSILRVTAGLVLTSA